MIFRMCGRTLLAVGIVLTLNDFAIAEDATKVAGPASTTKRLDLKTSEADRDAIEEVCRRRRLFKRRYASETYYLPPATTYSAPPIEYSVPPVSAEPPIAPARVEPPTLPAPISPAPSNAPTTYRYDGSPVAGPRPMPQRVPVAPVKPQDPSLGPNPAERMVAAPKAPTKNTYPAYGDRRGDDTVLLKGSRK